MIKVDDILPFSESSWDKGISAGSSAEMEIHLTDKVTTIPQMRRILAVKGYIRNYDDESKATSKASVASTRCARWQMPCAVSLLGIRVYRLPATFRSPRTDSPEWRQAHLELSQTAFRVFAELALEGEPAPKALRMLRSLIRGFVLNEMATSFLEPLDFERSFQLAIDAFIMGLPAFKSPIDQSVT
jgi:hypothetical protein